MTTHGWNFGVSDVVNLPTSQGTGYVLAPDGAGGLTWIATSSIGVTDHGALTGLADDDHTQYHNDSRALTWHGAFASTHVTGGDAHDHNGGDGAQVDHGGLVGLSDDDHTGYLLATGTRTGASSAIQPFTNGVQVPIVRATGSSVIFKDSTGATSWATWTSSAMTLHPYPYTVNFPAEGTLKTVSDVWWQGIFVKNLSDQSVAYFDPRRGAEFGAVIYSAAALAAKSPSATQSVLYLVAHSGQAQNVVQIVDRNGKNAYYLTYDNQHWYLGDMFVGGRVSSAPAFNRIQGSSARYTVTPTNHTYYDGDLLFSGMHASAHFKCNATVEGTLEIDFNPYVGWTVNGYDGFTYVDGMFYINFFSEGSAAQNISVDIYHRGALSDQWTTNVANVPNNASKQVVLSIPQAGNYLKKLRVRVSHPTQDVWVSGISYFPNAPENAHEMIQAPRYTGERYKLAHKGADYYDTAWTIRHTVDYQVADGASAVAYMHDTKNALSTSGALLASWKNNGTLKMSIDKDGQLIPVGGILLSATNLVTDTTTGAKLATSSTQKLGAWGATPVVRPSAYTQTYSTADKTLAAYTSDAEGSAYTGIDNAQGGTPYAQLTDLNALRTAHENLRAFVEDTAQMLNSVVDDLQTIGWLA